MLELKGIIIIIFALFILLVTQLNGKQVVLDCKIFDSQTKPIKIGYIIILFLFWLFAISVNDSHDIYFYKYAYENQTGHGKEAFFDTLTFRLYDYGFTFNEFKALWVTIIAILLIFGIRKITNNSTLLAAIFLISPATLYITGMRSSMAGAIMLNMIPLLFSNKKFPKVIYIIAVLLCAQIHIVSYIYLVFLFQGIMKKKRIRLFAFYLVLFFTICAIIFNTRFSTNIKNNTLTLFSGILDENSLNRVSSYFEGEGNHLRYSIYLVIKHLFFYFITDKACNILISETRNQSDKKNWYHTIQRINIVLLFILPITVLSASFERIFSYFLLLQYAVVIDAGMFKNNYDRKYKKCKKYIVPCLCGAILFFISVELFFYPDDLIQMLNSI